MVDLRIYKHARLKIERGEETRIIYRGKPIKAFTREPVVLALFAAGIRTIARSLKYHRPRGAFCFWGSCNSCRMRIDGVPSQRACKILCRENLLVEDESGIPNADFDYLFVADFVYSKKMEYHRMFLRPTPLNNIFARIIRRFASNAQLPTTLKKFEKIEEEKVKLLIIGAGASGLALARLVADSQKPLVVDSHFEAGGRLLFEDVSVDNPWTQNSAGFELAKIWAKEAEEKGARFFLNSEVVGFAEEGCWIVRRPDRLSLIWADKTVVATGAYDQPFGFARDDLPRIVSARGARRLVNYWGLYPALRAFVVGTGYDGLMAAKSLSEIEVRVMGVAEPSSTARCEELVSSVERCGFKVFYGYKPLRAVGRFHLRGIELVPTSGIGESLKFMCDLIVVDSQPQPAYELLAQAGVDVRFDLERKRFLPSVDSNGSTSVQGLFAIGEVTGVERFSDIFNQVKNLAGRLVGS